MSKLMLSMVLGVAGLFAPLQDERQSPPVRRFEYSQIHMGVAVRITLYTNSSEKAEAAAKAAYARAAELEQILSDYRPTSEISVLCRKAIYGPVKVSDDLYRVLLHSLEVARLSGGAFDPTVGPLVALWREARRTGRLPTPESIAWAKERVGWRFVELDRRARTVFLRKHNLKVDFGGIAKGDACDQLVQVLARNGIKSAMVEAGGDIAVSDPPPGSKGWVIAIIGTDKTLSLSHAAVSTSGDLEQFVEIGGVRYSHIVDPKTGMGLTNRIQATVVARRGLTTDPLATMVCVLGEERSRSILQRYRAKAILKLP